MPKSDNPLFQVRRGALLDRSDVAKPRNWICCSFYGVSAVFNIPALYGANLVQPVLNPITEGGLSFKGDSTRPTVGFHGISTIIVQFSHHRDVFAFRCDARHAVV